LNKTGNINLSPVFDAVGVSKYIPQVAAFNWFRKVVLKARVPFAWQERLAALLQDEANRHNNGVLSIPFAKSYEEYIPLWVDHPGTKITEGEMDDILIKAEVEQLKRRIKAFKKLVGGFGREGHEITSLVKKLEGKNPQVYGVFDADFRFSLKLTKRIIDTLAEKLSTDRR
jgi:hypothetical protein